MLTMPTSVSVFPVKSQLNQPHCYDAYEKKIIPCYYNNMYNLQSFGLMKWRNAYYAYFSICISC
jgi:hypothetical protein